MLEETAETEEIIERVAALDIGKAELVCCVRVRDEGRAGRRLQEVEAYSTMTRSLLGLADRLRCLGVTRVVMEATSDYWKPVFYILEAHGLETWLVNAKDVMRTAEKQRVEKLLEDACINLSAVASDIFGKSGRAMPAGDGRGRAQPQGAGAAGPVGTAPQDQRAARGRGAGSSPNTTRSCWARCSPASTPWMPTSPNWISGSRT